AVYSDAVSKGSENGNVNMYINRYDVSSDSWEGYKTIMSDEDAALTASDLTLEATGISYKGKFYAALPISVSGYVKTLLVCTESGKSDYSYNISNSYLKELTVARGELCALIRDSDYADVCTIDPDSLDIESSLFKITDKSYIDSFVGVTTTAGGGILGGFNVSSSGMNLAYLDVDNSRCIDLGSVGANTGDSCVVNSVAVYGSCNYPEIYVNAIPSSKDEEPGIYSLADDLFGKQSVEKSRLSNSFLASPAIMTDGSDDITLTVSNSKNNKKAAFKAAKTSVSDSDLVEAHRSDCIDLSASTESDTLNFKCFDMPALSEVESNLTLKKYKANPHALYVDSFEYSESRGAYVTPFRAVYSKEADEEGEEGEDIERRHYVKFADYDLNISPGYITLKEGDCLADHDLPYEPDQLVKVESGSVFKGWYKSGKSPFNMYTPVTEDIVLVPCYVTSDYSRSGMDSDIDISGSNVYLVKGQSFTFGADKTGQWVSSDSRYLRIDKKTGKASPRAATTGLSDKTVRIENLSDKAAYDVIIYEPELSEKKAAMTVGESLELTIADKSGEEINSSLPITWVSSKPDVAAVCNGRVYANAKGKANITAYINGVGYVSKITVNDTYKYSNADLNEKLDISICMTPFSFITLKKSSQLGFDPNKVGVNNWEYDKSIISVTDKGKVTAVGIGTTTLTGKDSVTGVTRNITITVKSLPSEKTIHLGVGKSKQLKINNVNNKEAKWKSSSDAVTVKDGKIKAVSVGSAVITCSYKDVNFYTTVYVEEPGLVTDESLTKANPSKPVYALTLDLSDNKPYKLVVNDSIHQELLFNSNKKAVAFVDEAGIVYPREAGKTILKAAINGKTIMVNVTVK
nr:hypothetical protein [Lachnospiraceae bacterium]